MTTNLTKLKSMLETIRTQMETAKAQMETAKVQMETIQAQISQIEFDERKKFLFMRKTLDGMTRRQLQKLAKEHRINSNAKSETIKRNLLLIVVDKDEITENGEHYDIIDNGHTIYRVCMNENSACVYDSSRIDDTFTVLIKEFSARNGTFMRGFVGKDTSGSGCDGCSILVQMNKNQYTYIGDKIYSFRCEEQILSYYSRMGYPWGNSGEPSPVALTENSVLFMPDRIKVPKVNLRDYVEDRLNGDWGNAYEAFYSEGGRGHLNF